MKEEIKYDDYTDVGTVFLKGMLLDKYRCKKCGHLGKITIITNVPLDIICDSCEREEKIDNILNK
jgi:hypothetical protein